MKYNSEKTPFERWMRNQIKKKKNIDDQEILDEILEDLKKKHEKERLEKIDKLQHQIEKIRG